MDKKDLIIEKQNEYIQLLEEELSSMIGIAHLHGWRSERADKGKLLREELVKLRNLEN